jgi:hypothetical protein
MRSVRLGSVLGSGGRRVAHGLDAVVVSLLMELVARVAERQLLSLAQKPSPDGAVGDQSAAAEPTPR